MTNLQNLDRTCPDLWIRDYFVACFQHSFSFSLFSFYQQKKNYGIWLDLLNDSPTQITSSECMAQVMNGKIQTNKTDPTIQKEKENQPNQKLGQNQPGKEKWLIKQKRTGTDCSRLCWMKRICWSPVSVCHTALKDNDDSNKLTVPVVLKQLAKIIITNINYIFIFEATIRGLSHPSKDSKNKFYIIN